MREFVIRTSTTPPRQEEQTCPTRFLRSESISPARSYWRTACCCLAYKQPFWNEPQCGESLGTSVLIHHGAFGETLLKHAHQVRHRKTRLVSLTVRVKPPAIVHVPECTDYMDTRGTCAASQRMLSADDTARKVCTETRSCRMRNGTRTSRAVQKSRKSGSLS